MLAEMIASTDILACDHINESIISLISHMPDEIVIEIFRASASVLSGRLEPDESLEMEGFIAAHRKVLGLFLDSLDK